MRAGSVHLTAVAVVVSAGLGLGCPKVVKDVNDKTTPSVVIKVRGADGQYAVATEATMSAAASGQLDLMCIVEDPQGVRSASLHYSSGTGACNVNGAVYTGSFTISPVPPLAKQTLEGDASGKVLTKLPLLGELNGPFSCSVPANGTGTPYGATITVTCTGSNWAADASQQTSQKKLAVKLQ